ncbi:hypothetical protein PWEIH_11345 [Listeria weihenstephanensis FSL R9-0317]|uniref:DUF3130 family protein n=1 Tax=Listeria weihenstephanensis TaxID=1006155 RepID=A0A1S7FV74_9LIST|nr:DUF3130 family protein [Listeria weihenstephanensis]AQY51303.1 hypothetical protein UE46_09715 [Listeria weihenstephanensis]EUJ36754.1 hypothetical protein PWEIH_11345 [Listeria weihenstephanensis FSL R9-0317]MBC1500265.1 DUF3130 family protein [Listeria weihenstephanensis]
MSEIKVNRDVMMNHAANLGDSVQQLDYYPMKNNNMSYTQSHSISNCRETLITLLESVESFKDIVQEDAIRIKQVGEAYAAKDQEVGQKLQMEVR